jgi:lipoprotein-anchoring transpeptidase ErfK/SrfK
VFLGRERAAPGQEAYVPAAPTPTHGPADLDPWVSPGASPLPIEAHSVLITRDDEPLLTAPQAGSPRRGSAVEGARLPIFAVNSGSGCAGRWLMVGPMAWVCRSFVDLSQAEPLRAQDTFADRADGLPFHYFFVGRGGSAAYRRFEFADAAEPDQEMQPGFGVAAVAERARGGDSYVRTHHGMWVPLRDLVPVRPTLFHGEEIGDGRLDVAWVLNDRTPVYTRPDGLSRARPPAVKMRFEVMHVREDVSKNGQKYLRVGDEEWVRDKDVRRPTVAKRPEGLLPGERWVDVELASQTLVVFEGERPVFATLVSTGKGAQGTPTGTPKGEHRIWVKLRSSTMDNLEDESAASTYALEDVPYVQFFHKGVALHGAFWHRNFGRVHSHGCVNLAPLDAQRVFHLTSPRLPAGWSAALPTDFEPGTLIRVR